MNTVIERQELHPEAWFDSYNDIFIAYTYHRVNDIEVAKDLVQETFLHAFKAVPDFRGVAKERTWLTSILKHKIIDHYRKKNAKKNKIFIRINKIGATHDYNWIEERVADSSHAKMDLKFDREALKDLIQQNIEKLPKRQAQAIHLKNLGWKTEDICEELGISPTNLWVALHRARKSLKLQLGSFVQ